MSLTSFIKIPVIKEIFRKEFPMMQSKLEGEFKAKPITKNYSLVGTAFDYLFRFYLEQKNPNCITKGWIAEESVLLLDAMRNKHPKWNDEMEQASKKMKNFLEESKKSHADFLSRGTLDEKIIRTAVILAQMDVFYRSGSIPPNLGAVEDGDVEDLRNLISILDPDMFRAKKHCFLNPTFGYGSTLVDGADADLVIAV